MSAVAGDKSMNNNGRKYFGTDGIRGRVGEHPITAEFCLRLGWAVGKVFASDGSRLVLIGKDTRISGYMIESVLEAGLVSAGVDVRLLTPIPTPAVAYLTRTFRADAGIVISASHNRYDDNGIKFFDSGGNKLPDEMELAIEQQMEAPLNTVRSSELGKVERLEDARGRYIEFCKGTVDRRFRLRGLKVVVDCAHGSTYAVAPRVFSELGADVTVIGAEPNGININEGCGSTHPEAMAEKVVSEGADVGIALDGDGDRVIMADGNGEIVDGDDLLYIIASHSARTGRLSGGVVGTIMTNSASSSRCGERAFHSCARMWATDMYWRRCATETGRSAGSPRATSSARISPRPEMASSPRCRLWCRWWRRASTCGSQGGSEEVSAVDGQRGGEGSRRRDRMHRGGQGAR